LKGFLIKKGIHCGTHLKSRGTHFQNPNFYANCSTQNQLENALRKNHNSIFNKSK
jgi:hypothetical protein